MYKEQGRRCCNKRRGFGYTPKQGCFAGSERSTPRGEAYRRRQGLPVSLHLHQWLTTVGEPILTFSVTADGSYGRITSAYLPGLVSNS